MVPKVTIPSKVTYSIWQLQDMHVMKIDLQHDYHWPLRDLSQSHTVYSRLWKSHFSALSLSRLSAYLLRLIQQYDIATRAKESKNKEAAPALADITILLASSCCLFESTFSVTWLLLYLSFNPQVRGCRAEPLGVIDIDRNHCCR